MKKKRSPASRRVQSSLNGKTMFLDAAAGAAVGMGICAAFLLAVTLVLWITGSAMEQGRFLAMGAKSLAGVATGMITAWHGGALAKLRGGVTGALVLLALFGIAGAWGGAVLTPWTLALDAGMGFALGITGSLMARIFHP